MTQRSLTGYCIFLGDCLVSWKTKKQTTVSSSTAEAEYRSMAATVQELKWITYMLHDLQLAFDLPIRFHCDNQAAIFIAENPVFHERTKHIEMDCHIVRDAYKDGFISLTHVPTKDQVADVFTKSLSLTSFLHFLSKLHLSDVELEGRLLEYLKIETGHEDSLDAAKIAAAECDAESEEVKCSRE